MLEVDKLNVFYDEIQALKEVSLKVNDGELVVLFGANGHGKSTLLKTIAGLLIPRSGDIKFKGRKINGLAMPEIVEMGLAYIAEERHLFPEMTVIENLKLGAHNSNARKKETENLSYTFSLFPSLGKLENRLASTLSGGERRMLAIGRGLMSSAECLLVDEPSLGLAPNLRSSVFARIGDINKSGTSILLVEQNVVQVSNLADRIYLMEDGKITLEGRKEEIMGSEHVKEVLLGI